MQGNRDNIDGMASGSAKVLQQVLKLVDAHDLYGSVAYPKRHTQADISDIYRLPFATRGVFTNVALQEPFGLTVIEVLHRLTMLGMFLISFGRSIVRASYHLASAVVDICQLCN